MIIDTRELQNNTKFDADICIIGSGAAGITIAKTLGNSHLKIIMLESGGLESNTEVQDLAKGEISARQYFDLDVSRLRYFGGSTNHWGGRCLPLREDDFEDRPWIPHSGWPFSFKQLKSYYERAHNIIGLGSYNYDIKAFSESKGLPLFPFGDGPIKSILTRTHPLRFGKAYRQEIKDSKTITTLLNAHVLKLETNEDASSVTGVDVGTLSGNSLSVKARSYIVACGGIENPRLLLLSNQVKEKGLGNDYDQVGRYFMEHLLYSGGLMVISDINADYRIYADYIKSEGIDIQSTLAFDPEYLKKMRLPNLYFELQSQRGYGFTEGMHSVKDFVSSAKKFEWPDNLVDQVANIAKDLDLIIDGVADSVLGESIIHDNAPLAFRLYAFGEQVPNPNSRVTLGNNKDSFGLPVTNLAWNTTDEDIQGIHKSFEVLASEVGRTGIGRVKIMLEKGDNPPLSRLSGGQHHMGTTRMSIDPKQGVVDSNCQVHGVDNLFIAGSSVFPTSGFANPTLTIVALALKLADYLKERVS